MCTLYIVGRGGCTHWELGSAGAATWSFNWWASVYFGAIQFQLSFRCITCLQIAGTVSRSVPFPSLDLHLYFYSHSPNLVQERFNVISVLFLLFYFPRKVKVKTKLQRKLQRTTNNNKKKSSKFLERTQKKKCIVKTIKTKSKRRFFYRISYLHTLFEQRREIERESTTKPTLGQIFMVCFCY